MLPIAVVVNTTFAGQGICLYGEVGLLLQHGLSYGQNPTGKAPCRIGEVGIGQLGDIPQRRFFVCYPKHLVQLKATMFLIALETMQV